MENKFPMIIGGEKISSEQLIGVINPSNEQLIGYVFNADIALMEKSLISAKNGFDKWSSFTPNKRKEIILIQQFRAGVISRYDEDYLFEIVAGIIDENETPEETAKRECFEETGCIVNKVIPVQGYFPAPGSSESYYDLFLGEVNSFEGERIRGLETENENILVKSYKVEEVRNMLKKGKIKSGLTLIALQWFFLEYY